MGKTSGFNINIKTKIKPKSEIIKRLGLNNNGKTMEFMRNEADRLMTPFIPGGASGQLAKNKTYPSANKIKYISPHAHYQHTGKRYISPKLGVSGILLRKYDIWWSPKGEKKIATNKKLKYHIPGTGDYWEKRMMQKRKDDLIRSTERFLKTGGE